ncbi:MAG: thiamine diphosphokinase [Ruminiclostridium sp.]|nr:thiamine diphosphokinase [Ruminiclostridium sp.]
MSDAACFIFGSGPFYGLVEIPKPTDRILAADGGYRHCVKVGLQPNLILGDFDSLDHLPPELESKKFPVEKDDTDTMLAIKLGLELGHRRFHLYGGTGGRMDHTLANLQALAYLAQAGARGYLYDEGYVFTAIRNGHLSLPARNSGIFSVFCLGAEARGVSVQGGQYSVLDSALSPFFPLGVSNHFQGLPVEIDVIDGCLLIGWELD